MESGRTEPVNPEEDLLQQHPAAPGFNGPTPTSADANANAAPPPVQAPGALALASATTTASFHAAGVKDEKRDTGLFSAFISPILPSLRSSCGEENNKSVAKVAPGGGGAPPPTRPYLAMTPSSRASLRMESSDSPCGTQTGQAAALGCSAAAPGGHSPSCGWRHRWRRS